MGDIKVNKNEKTEKIGRKQTQKLYNRTTQNGNGN